MPARVVVGQDDLGRAPGQGALGDGAHRHGGRGGGALGHEVGGNEAGTAIQRQEEEGFPGPAVE